MREKGRRLLSMLVSIAIMFGSFVVALPEEGPHQQVVSIDCSEPRAVRASGQAVGDWPSGRDSLHWQQFEPTIIVPVDFPTIQSAEDNACSGDVILVRSGYYSESVIIDKENLYFIGQGHDETLIMSTSGPAFTIIANNVSIDSFGIEGSVLVDGVEGALLTKGSVSGGSPSGIMLQGVSNSQVSGMEIEGSTIGIRLISSSTNNKIGTANTILNTNVGISVEGSSKNNEVSLNEVSGGNVGIALDGSQYNILGHNRLHSLGANGIEVEGGSDGTTVAANEVWDLPTGLSVSNSDNIAISENAIEAINEAIVLESVVGANLQRNSVASNTNAALSLSLGTKNLNVEANAFRDSPFGVRADGVLGLKIAENSFGAGGVGLEVVGAVSPAIKMNYFWRQTQPSISVASSTNAVVQGNHFTGGLDWAIDALGTDGLRIEGNEVFSHQNGIRIEGDGSASVEGNDVRYSVVGVSLTASAGSELVGNRISRNSVGLDLQTNGVSIHHNRLLENVLQVSTSTSSAQNTWNDGSGKGNFWSDYTGEDLNYDGVGDTILPHQGVDFFPLTKEDFGTYLRIVELVEEARSKLEDAGIHHGILNSLTKKLDHVQRALMRDGVEGAGGSLDAFHNEVGAQTNKKIPPGLADELNLIGIDIGAAIGDVDIDGDGLKQSSEEALGTDPRNPDTDGDWANDSCEHSNGLNPLDGVDGFEDSDYDDLDNWLECLLLTDIDDEDSDGDNFESFTDGEEYSFWLGFDDDMDMIFLIDLILERIDPYPDDGSDPFTEDNHINIETMRDYLNLPDADGDGYFDGWERIAPHFDPLWPRDAGVYEDPDEDILLNIREHRTWRRGLATDPRIRDVIVEVDWMVGYDPRGDTKTYDWGDPMKPGSWDAGGNGIDDQFEPAWKAFDLAGINLILSYDDQIPAGADRNTNRTEANDLYDDNYDALDPVHHLFGVSRYGLIVDKLWSNTLSGKSPGFRVGYRGDYFLTAAGTINTRNNANYSRVIVSVFMHELGHALGLWHGGDLPTNYKKNYNSIMNYRYVFTGADGDGDNICYGPLDGVIDFSYGLNVPIDEGFVGEKNMNCDGVFRGDPNDVPNTPDGVLGERDARRSDDGTYVDHDPDDDNIYDYDDWQYIIDTLDTRIEHTDL